MQPDLVCSVPHQGSIEKKLIWAQPKIGYQQKLPAVVKAISIILTITH